jgi:hypothetical protein
MLGGLGTIISTFGVAWGVSYLLNGHKAHLTSRIINDARFVSAIVVFWGFLGRTGEEIPTWSGRTLPEQVNRYWPRFLHIIGVGFTFTAFLLRPT